MTKASLKKRSQLALEQLQAWMEGKDRKPFPFQRKIWRSMLAGESGILHSPTGTGKTLGFMLSSVSSPSF